MNIILVNEKLKIKICQTIFGSVVQKQIHTKTEKKKTMENLEEIINNA